jgi:hypothetical protein
VVTHVFVLQIKDKVAHFHPEYISNKGFDQIMNPIDYTIEIFF